jgi:hypothetical protein
MAAVGVTITSRDETIANPLDSGLTMGNGSRRRLVGEPNCRPTTEVRRRAFAG